MPHTIYSCSEPLWPTAGPKKANGQGGGTCINDFQIFMSDIGRLAANVRMDHVAAEKYSTRVFRGMMQFIDELLYSFLPVCFIADSS